MTKQVENGKSFEFALIMAFCNLLKKNKIDYTLEQTKSLKNAESYFTNNVSQSQNEFFEKAILAAKELFNLEPRLQRAINQNDVLKIKLAKDSDGQKGDVRDLIFIRSEQKQWEIGISAKNNHKAVKHSRLSDSIDFGKEWIGVGCSSTYFTMIKPIFDGLRKQMHADRTKKWADLDDKNDIYKQILKAFIDEMSTLLKNKTTNCENLVRYLLGNNDFYKVIKTEAGVEIQAFNLSGNLGCPFNSVKPTIPPKKLKMPSKLLKLDFKTNSATTVEMTFDQGWAFSFRIHSARTLIEPSLKFDITIIGNPGELLVTRKP